MKEKFDAHGGAVLDLDRDGLLDLYVSQGAVGGTDTSYHSENGLFWGTPDGRLVGGRGTAREAGLLCRGCRGYNVAVADVDGDGLLDIISCNKDRNDDNAIPSRLWLNRPTAASRRNFAYVPQFAVYSSSALMTDFDQAARGGPILGSGPP
jgi:hypothetical protein